MSALSATCEAGPLLDKHRPRHAVMLERSSLKGGEVIAIDDSTEIPADLFERLAREGRRERGQHRLRVSPSRRKSLVRSPSQQRAGLFRSYVGGLGRSLEPASFPPGSQEEQNEREDQEEQQPWQQLQEKQLHHTEHLADPPADRHEQSAVAAPAGPGATTARLPSTPRITVEVARLFLAAQRRLRSPQPGAPQEERSRQGERPSACSRSLRPPRGLARRSGLGVWETTSPPRASLLRSLAEPWTRLSSFGAASRSASPPLCAGDLKWWSETRGAENSSLLHRSRRSSCQDWLSILKGADDYRDVRRYSYDENFRSLLESSAQSRAQSRRMRTSTAFPSASLYR